MKPKRIVITGIGVISPIGIGKAGYWQSLKEGRSGFRPITVFDSSGLDVKTAGEITEFDPAAILGQKGLRYLDRATRLLLSATKLALDDSKTDISTINSVPTGISVGTSFGSLNSMSAFDRVSLQDGPNLVNASLFPNTVMNAPASRDAIRFGIKGPNATLSTGFCAASDALEYALERIQRKGLKRVIVGTVEEMCAQTFLGFYKLGYLSGLSAKREPLSCPFDKRRDGIIFSEGAAVVVVEELEAALERGASIYAEVLGTASGFDPFKPHKFNPRGTGMAAAMQSALEDCGLKPCDIDCIFANANSTIDADRIETAAIKEIFKEYAHKVPVSAIKSMIGETFSASGGLALVAALGSLQNDCIPPTINLNEPDPECDLDYVANSSRNQKIETAMVNTFSPNGENTIVVIGRFN